jgi:hypothetical protein
VSAGTPAGQATLAGGTSLGKLTQPVKSSTPTKGMPHMAAVDSLRESMAFLCMDIFLKKTSI